ncbi:carbamoyl-phosphate synthase large subunit [Saccharothrix texasensis]|uniref:Carbamoyl-phosphate synthase large subunit n=1 Tax=Saccharothrix texasensis TaxID=103734 RepID=A0A3N1GZ85_9PSEU|nr:carbamoyl-phosphate synthase large subunit [Saccharothrix texasensis]ROP35272.1 carbamoyl-phosphate synthase large subunit [Saccharothrix texasensis]
MPRRSEVTSVLVLGSGPVDPGAETDRAGARACRVLKAEGLRVILVDSDPAAITTGAGFADATYVEPVTLDVVEHIIAAERPDALLTTVGGRTALDTAVALHESGVLARHGVELIGADLDAIRVGGNREDFERIVRGAGGAVARAVACDTLEQCHAAAAELGYPVFVRTSSTTGRSGFAGDERQLSAVLGTGPGAHRVLIEESALGRREFALELLRDRDDDVIVVCSMENVDPVGAHPGDSIAVAPAMTPTGREGRRMREVATAVVRAIGVAGRCTVRFTVDPRTGHAIVAGATLHASRAGAFAATATGLPITEIATRLALGHTLDELPDAVTGETAFGPGAEHVAVRASRFAFDGFPTADAGPTARTEPVGEAVAIGRSFPEALNKALRALGEDGGSFSWAGPPGDPDASVAASWRPTGARVDAVHRAIRAGAAVADLAAATGIHPWFLDQVRRIEEVARAVAGRDGATRPTLQLAKRHGLSDARIGELRGLGEDEVRALRRSLGIRPGYRAVDRRAAESTARYSSYGGEPGAPRSAAPKVVILGSGPTRFGQGAEFDHTCAHASAALAAAGYETVVVDGDPRAATVDPGTGHRHYLEPLTVEDVLEVVAAEQATGEVVDVLVQLGGQTPLALAARLAAAGVPVVGVSPAAIDLAGDLGALSTEVGLPTPAGGTATSFAQAKAVADELGYPVLVRPSHVPGGRGAEIAHDERALAASFERAAAGSGRPVRVDRFLAGAIEVDVDALYDGRELYLGGVMEHVEEVGGHSGGSACTLPPVTLGHADVVRIRESTRALAHRIGVRGPLNVRYALAAGVLHVVEVYPGAGRTVPFAAAATGVPLAAAAARVALGSGIAELRAEGLLPAAGDAGTPPPDAAIAVRQAVSRWSRSRTPDGDRADAHHRAGAVMGIGATFGVAYAKAQAAARTPLPVVGRVFVSVANRDKRAVIFPVKALVDAGFEVLATAATAQVLHRGGVAVTVVRAPGDGPDGEPSIVDRVLAGEVDLVVSTSSGRHDGSEVRAAATRRGVPCVTTVQGLAATVQGIEAVSRGHAVVTPLREHLGGPSGGVTVPSRLPSSAEAGRHLVGVAVDRPR